MGWLSRKIVFCLVWFYTENESEYENILPFWKVCPPPSRDDHVVGLWLICLALGMILLNTSGLPCFLAVIYFTRDINKYILLYCL